MAWTVEFSEQADRDLAKLDPQQSRRILRFLEHRVAKLENPRAMGKPLQGSQFGELWRYRTGDFRILCKIEDEVLVVLVIRVGHRKEIYR